MSPPQPLGPREAHKSNSLGREIRPWKRSRAQQPHCLTLAPITLIAAVAQAIQTAVTTPVIQEPCLFLLLGMEKAVIGKC